MRLIDADALIIDLMDRGIEGLQTDDYSEIQQTVMAQPTIDPESKLTNDISGGDVMRLVNVESLDCLAWTDGEHGTSFNDGVSWVTSKIDELPAIDTVLRKDQIWEELSKVYNMPDVPDEAKEIIGNLMLALDDDGMIKQRL